MIARSLFHSLKSRLTRSRNRLERRSSIRPRLRARRLNAETLEDRRMLAFGAPVEYGIEGAAQAVVSGDFNNDTIPDLAVADYSGAVRVLLGAGNGAFQEPALSSPTGVNPLSIAVGDLDGDGNLDLATANAFDVSVLRGNGDGTF